MIIRKIFIWFAGKVDICEVREDKASLVAEYCFKNS